MDGFGHGHARKAELERSFVSAKSGVIGPAGLGSIKFLSLAYLSQLSVTRMGRKWYQVPVLTFWTRGPTGWRHYAINAYTTAIATRATDINNFSCTLGAGASL